MMKKTSLSKLTLATAITLAAGHSFAASSVTEAIEESTTSIDMRYRFENVEQDSMDNNANASTVRTRIGVDTGEVSGFSGHISLENVHVIGENDYDSKLNGMTDRPAVVDPEGSELNQAFVQYKTGDTTVRYGRQRVILDNARFVGNVGFRQNEQTFDAFTVVNQSIENVTAVYGYVTDVRTIKFGALNTTTHLANVAIDDLGPGKLSAYVYLIELEPSNAEFNTYGLRYAGKVNASDGLDILFTAEYATQEADDGTAASDPASDPETDYTLIEAGVVVSGITAKLGIETLGSDDGQGAFQTPIATKHAFNGWADQFLSGTPVNGLQDTYLNVGGKVSGVKLMAVYHQFDADEGGADIGSEIDLLAAKKLSDNYSVGFKYANFSADAPNSDVQKVWLWAEAKF